MNIKALSISFLLLLHTAGVEVCAQTSPTASISRTLSVLYIETAGSQPIQSTSEYINGKYWIESYGQTEQRPVGSKSNPETLQIRGRGHSSWKSKKKPYKIKLGAKTSLLGMPENKHWALIKPDEGNVAGYYLGKLLGMSWTPGFRPVEVVLNGDYIGLYFLTETIRIDNNRVDIYRQRDLETDPELIEGGWLVEIDNYYDNCQFVIDENKNLKLRIKYHLPEELSPEQLEWITDEFKKLNDAIYSKDKTSEEWEEYIDVESMAKFFIVQEVLDNPDGFHGSFYLHKDLSDNAKWKAGPLWDMVCYNREKD